jgi:hypothetical protein
VIDRLENGQLPRGPTMRAIRAVFEAEGIEFLPGGFRMREGHAAGG